MTLPVLRGRKWCDYGIQGSGKTELAKRIINEQFANRTLVITPSGQRYEWENAAVKCFYMGVHTIEELENAAKFVKTKAQQGKIKLLLIDEADLWLKHNFDLTPQLNELITSHRHFDLSIGFITRRPQDIPTVVTESSYAHFIYKMEGVNALNKLENMHPAMRELMQKIDYPKHNFIVKELGKEPYVHEAIEVVK